MNWGHATELVTPIIHTFEGFSSKPYLCPRGIPTVGFGATYYANRKKVTLFDPPISRADADQLLSTMISRDFMPGVLAVCPGIDNDYRLAAITDFAFNLGLGRLKTSTLRRLVNAGDWDLVRAELMKWVNAGGKVYKGLVKRRTLESMLI